jgi:hypothetical protein
VAASILRTMLAYIGWGAVVLAVMWAIFIVRILLGLG